MSWTKSFNCPGVEGEEVVGLLQKAIDAKEGLNIKVVAILNDTTGEVTGRKLQEDNKNLSRIDFNVLKLN